MEEEGWRWRKDGKSDSGVGGSDEGYGTKRQTDLWPSLCQSNDLHQVTGDVDVQTSTEVPWLQYPRVVTAPSAAKRELGDREGV